MSNKWLLHWAATTCAAFIAVAAQAADKKQNFQWVREQLRKEGLDLPMPTGN